MQAVRELCQRRCRHVRGFVLAVMARRGCLWYDSRRGKATNQCALFSQFESQRSRSMPTQLRISSPALILALCTFSGFLCAGAASAQDDTPLHRAKVSIDYVSKESLGGGVTVAKLNSGLTVIVRENHAAPVATVRSYVRNTGSAYEGPRPCLFAGWIRR